MNRRIVLPVLLCASLGSTMLYARPTAPPPQKRFVKADANEVFRKPLPGGNGSFTTLDGSVVITSEDSTLHTEKATYNDETQIATAPTRLRLDDKQNTLTADKGVAYYTTRDADFTGNVVINVRPEQGNAAAKGSLRKDFKDPVTITCGKVRYNWRTKKAVLTQNLVIKQKDRTITGDRGLYDGNTETVTLVGNVKSRRPTGEEGDAPGANSRLVAVLKEGNESLRITKDPSVSNGKVRAVIPVREKPNGEFEVTDSVDTPPAPAASPAGTLPVVPVLPDPTPPPPTPPRP